MISESFVVAKEGQIKPSNVVTIGLTAVGAVVSSPWVIGVTIAYTVVDGIYSSYTGNSMIDDNIDWRYDF